MMKNLYNPSELKDQTKVYNRTIGFNVFADLRFDIFLHTFQSKNTLKFCWQEMV